MSNRERFRDSWPLRIGVAIISLIVASWTALWLAERFWAFNPDVGPVGMLSALSILLGLGFITVGIGQTILRRRRRNK
jgi:hypothetical protein